jgi:hypothetical protein
MKGKTTRRGVYLLSFRCPHHGCHTARPLLPVVSVLWLFGVVLQWNVDSSECGSHWIRSGTFIDASFGQTM